MRSGGSWKSSKSLIAAIFLLIIFAGCGTKEAVRNGSAEDLRGRVETYWQHKTREELDKTYEMEYPLYKKQVTLVNYIKKNSNPLVKVNGFTIENISYDSDDSAQVKLMTNLTVKAPGAKPFTHDMVRTEHWARIDGKWYHVPSRSNVIKSGENQ
jgi:hypothetical protein